MPDNEKLTQLTENFKQLTEENQHYVIAIEQALMFAQNRYKDSTKSLCPVSTKEQRQQAD